MKKLFWAIHGVSINQPENKHKDTKQYILLDAKHVGDNVNKNIMQHSE